MDMYNAMSTLRAVRRLRPDPIPMETMERLFSAATWAPSGGNVQPWRVVAVTDAALKEALQKLYEPLWDNYTVGYRERMKKMGDAQRGSSERSLAAGDRLAAHMGEVPLIAVFCFNPEMMAITDADQPRPSVVGGGSVYPAVQNFLLAARTEGLGCVLTTLLCIEEPKVLKLLNIPDGWYTAAHIPVGYPIGGGHGPIQRKPLQKMISLNQWGEYWPN